MLTIVETYAVTLLSVNICVNSHMYVIVIGTISYNTQCSVNNDDCSVSFK